MMLRNICFILILSFLVCAIRAKERLKRDINEANCGVSGSATGLIVNGQSTVRGLYPWAVAIFTRAASGKSEYSCGGTLISADKVLTGIYCKDVKNSFYDSFIHTSSGSLHPV